MSLALVDGSVLVAFYDADDPRRAEVVAWLASGDALFAPAQLDAEIVSALRGPASVTPAVERAVPAALRHLAGFPIRRTSTSPNSSRLRSSPATPSSPPPAEHAAASS